MRKYANRLLAVSLVVFLICYLCGRISRTRADTLTCPYKPVTGDTIQAVHITGNMNEIETIINGLIDSGNIEDGTITGSDLAAAIAINTSGACTFSGTLTVSGVLTYSAATLALDDGSGATPSVIFQDGSDENVEIYKADGSFLGISTEAVDGVKILQGNLWVGDGTPGQTINGEDAYIEGLLEVDGVIHADGGVTGDLTGNVTGDLTGNVTGNVTGDLTGNVTSSGTSTFDDIDVNGGAIDGTPIGASSVSTGAFSTITSTGNVSFSGDLQVNGQQIGISTDTDLLSLAANALTVNGTLDTTGDATFESLTMSKGKYMYFGSSDTYIYADTESTENLRIGADNNIKLEPDGWVQISFSSNMGKLYLYRGTGSTVPALRIYGGSTGDASLQFSTDTQDISIGVDGDSDKFKISDYTRLGIFDRLTMDTSGNFTIAQNLTVSGDLTVNGSIIGYSAYDSGWFAIEDDSTYTKTHDLGTTRCIVQIWVSTANDGSADEYNVSGPMNTNYEGTHMVDITTTEIKIVTGSKIFLGRNSSGSNVAIDASGYARIIMLALE